MEKPPFAVGDIVETVKGAKFWGRVMACYPIPAHARHSDNWEWRADVYAIDPGFFGTIHVYPTAQLAHRATSDPSGKD
jgi:hypothetical protein